jgi:hypothetical protein
MSKGIDHLIICSPFAEPDSHWAYDRETQRFERKPGRRPASYTIATPGTRPPRPSQQVARRGIGSDDE